MSVYSIGIQYGHTVKDSCLSSLFGQSVNFSIFGQCVSLTSIFGHFAGLTSLFGGCVRLTSMNGECVGFTSIFGECVCSTSIFGHRGFHFHICRMCGFPSRIYTC